MTIGDSLLLPSSCWANSILYLNHVFACSPREDITPSACFISIFVSVPFPLAPNFRAMTLRKTVSSSSSPPTSVVGDCNDNKNACVLPALYRTGRGLCQGGPPDRDPPPSDPREQNDWHMPVKTIPCPKLRLRAVITQVETSNAVSFPFLLTKHHLFDI